VLHRATGRNERLYINAAEGVHAYSVPTVHVAMQVRTDEQESRCSLA